MKTTPVSLTLRIGLVGACCFFTVGCAHQDAAPALSTQAGASKEAAISAVQSDATKSPEQKVKEIDAI